MQLSEWADGNSLGMCRDCNSLKIVTEIGFAEQREFCSSCDDQTIHLVGVSARDLFKPRLEK